MRARQADRCDLCGCPAGECEKVMLMKGYQTPEVKEVCRDCEKELNVIVWWVKLAMQKRVEKSIKSIIRRARKGRP